MVVVDRLTKLAHFVACKETATAADVAELVVAHVVKHHGVSETILTDRDPRF